MISPLGVRPDLVNMEPYVSPQRPARYRLNTNESPYPPPPIIVDTLTSALADIAFNRYPDKDAFPLVEAISDRHDWPAEGISVGNGSNEVFLHLFLAYGGASRTVLTFEPTYPLHSLIARIAGTKVRALRRADAFSVDLDAAITAIQRDPPEVVVVCSPNNPTGNVEPLASIAAICKACRGLVVVDEAYGEFADPTDSAMALLDEFPNLLVTRTMSKAWRLAGVRVGYMLARPEVIAGIGRVRLPYHLSSITQLIAATAMRHADETLEVVRAIAMERERISMGLSGMGFKTYPSKANFVLFEVEDPDRIWGELLERDVLVRNYSSVEGLERCLRVTAGQPNETDAFLKALGEISGG